MPKRTNPVRWDPDLPGKIRNALAGGKSGGNFQYTGPMRSARPGKAQGGKGGGKVSSPVAVRKKKPKPGSIGTQKGDWRKVGNLWKQRRFTTQQRRTFRSHDHVFGGPDDGRPPHK